MQLTASLVGHVEQDPFPGVHGTSTQGPGACKGTFTWRPDTHACAHQLAGSRGGRLSGLQNRLQGPHTPRAAGGEPLVSGSAWWPSSSQGLAQGPQGAGVQH